MIQVMPNVDLIYIIIYFPTVWRVSGAEQGTKVEVERPAGKC